MASQGKRMVPEKLIKEIGQGGGGGSYTAGDGIKITNDVISVDNTVALKSELFSGDYDDLTNKPDLSVYELAADAFSGDYDDLTDKPDLSVYELAADAFSGDYDDLTNKPDLSVYAESANLATVATTGDYDDLTNKPTIPAAQVNSDWNASSGVAEILNKPTLATVATTGAYSDLTGKPTIPTVNNNTITFTQGGVTKGSFTLNQSSDATIALDAGGGGSTEVAIGWLPDGATRTNYDFSNDTLADLITLGLPIIATNDNENYPLDSNIVIGERYKLYGAALVINSASNYKVVYIGNNMTTDNPRYGLVYAQNTSAAVVYLSGFTISQLAASNTTSDTTYGVQVYGSTVTGGNLPDVLATPISNNSLQNTVQLQAGNSYWNASTDERIKGINSISIQPYATLSSTNTSTNAVIINNNVNLKNAPLLQAYEAYMNSIILNGNDEYEIGFTKIDKTFIDPNVMPNPTGLFDGTYVLEATVDSGNPTFAWTTPSGGSQTLSTTDDTFVQSTSTSTDSVVASVTATTSNFVTGTSTTTETLTFTYSDNTTANITIVTAVTDSVSSAVTGVSTTSATVVTGVSDSTANALTGATLS